MITRVRWGITTKTVRFPIDPVNCQCSADILKMNSYHFKHNIDDEDFHETREGANQNVQRQSCSRAANEDWKEKQISGQG